MPIDLASFSREDLIKLVKMYAKGWLAMDGCWFLGIEEEKGLETAMHYDTKAWERFAPIEAKRIMKEFNIPQNGGLDSLEKTLNLRLYAQLNDQMMERPDSHTLIFKMNGCRVQDARTRDGRPDFPCKEIGLVEYSRFASTVDSRITTECIACPPDAHPKEWWCAWKFTLHG
ncbi:MAG: DUF6125 family protein [Candidatus Hodarchaeales archaeon]|jgi:hypothetical protein